MVMEWLKIFKRKRDKVKEFNLEQYLKLLLEDKSDEAFKYRTECMPDFVYKFYPLGTQNDERTFTTLKNDQLWFAKPGEQNDPFEFRGIYLDSEKLKEAGVPTEIIERCKKLMKEEVMCCFVENMDSNFSMWAHYANNHHGFCVKYKITNKKIIRNVIYQPVRYSICNIVRNAIEDIKAIDSGECNSGIGLNRLCTILRENLFIKHDSWKAEQEYRIVLPINANMSENGIRKEVKEVGLETQEIICGFNCSEDHKRRLKIVANDLKVCYDECHLSDTEYAVYTEADENVKMIFQGAKHMKTIFITGASGFIGSNLAKRILSENPDMKVIGLDNMNDYYDVRIKEARLTELQGFENYTFVKGNLADKALIDRIFEEHHPDIVVNLGAQAGVRYSISNPDAYMESNTIGFYNILEACRHYPVEHLVYASSSSVYGSNKKVPYSTEDKVDNPVSLYAATKKSNELMAHAYAKLYNIPSTGLRFFTVYGPAGRPDMAYFGFTDKLVRGETIKIFNYGNCRRDFTYIDDIVEGVIRVMQKAPEKRNGEDGLPIPPYKIYNIGNSNPENLLDFVQILSEELVRAGVLPSDYDFEAHKELVPMQPGDVPVTYADTTPLEQDFGFKPHTPLREGLRKFAEWYKAFYMA